MMEGEQKIAQCLNDQKVLGSNSKARFELDLQYY